MGKSIFKSKTFWINALSVVGSYLGALPAGATKSVAIMAGVNVLLRLVTNQPAYVIPPDK